MTRRPDEKIALFIDGANLHAAARALDWCDADRHALDKTGRRRHRWAGMPHMARVRLLMLTGQLQKPEVPYRHTIELGS